MNQSDAQLFKLTALIFKAALGNTYYQDFSGLLNQIGFDSLAQLFGASDVARDVLGSTPEAQARALTLHLGLNPDSNDPASGDYIAHEFFLANLQAGMNVGTLALAAVRYLEQDDILPALETTRDYLNNRAEVAYQYSKELGWGDTNLTTLQAVIESVSSDERSISVALTEAAVDEFERLRDSNPFTTYSDDDDMVTGTDDVNYIETGAGYDEVRAGKGADIIFGGTGDDELYGEKGQDWLEGGDGADTLYAGSYYESNTVDAWFEILNGGSGADEIYGGYGSDTIDGGEGADTIYGEGNNNYYISTILGNLANLDSSVQSRLFNDFISGGEGDDYINSEAGSDTVYGGAGNDTIYAGYGSDTVYGGAGDDRITLNYSASSKSELDGQNTAFGEDGNDTIYAVGNDNVAGGNGNDTINFYRTSNSSDHGAIIAGEGTDTISISSYYDDAFSNLTIDLAEVVQLQDRVSISIPDRVTAIIEIQNFDLATDLLDLPGYVDVYAPDSSSNGYTDSAQDFNYSGDLLRNYVQIVTAVATPWQEDTYAYPDHTSPDDYGKAFFVIQGAQAGSASTADVATLIDSYGNNASYGNSDRHFFIVNVSESDLGIYLFKDDTGANDRVVSDELTPIAVLTGVTTEDMTYGNVDFLI